MEISKGIEIRDCCLWLKKEKILILNDLHLGYEEALQRRGILIPKFQLQEILSQLEKILQEVTPKIVIINGDLKHEFGTVLRQEWNDVLVFLDFLLKRTFNIIIIRGNHDPTLKYIAEKRALTITTEYRCGDTLIVHGDELVTTDAKRIIIGHEHPAVTLREGSKWEKYKCFLKGTWKRKELIAVPSFNPLLEGTDILKEELLSPFLNNIKNFHIYITNKGEVYEFRTVKELL